MDEGVHSCKSPDWRRHVAHASPHRQHGTSVVVLLKCGTTLALDNENGCVYNLIELGQVEPPAPEGKSLIPDSADIGLVRQSPFVYENLGVETRPSAVVSMIDDGIAKTAGTVNLAQ